MIVILLKLAAAGVTLVPWLWWATAWWRRRVAGSAASEAALAAGLVVVGVLTLEVVAIAVIPVGRPLRALAPIHVIASAAVLGAVARRGRESLGVLRELWNGARSALADGFWAQRAAMVLGVLLQLFLIGIGLLRSPWAADHVAYHFPQALQLWQDQAWGPVRANIEWADSYPRGCAFLVFWIMQFTGGSDVGGHLVQGVSGFGFMLATYVAARRVGLDRSWSAFAASLLPACPLWMLLSVSGYIDIYTGALVAAMIAFALPRAGRSWDWGSAWACLLAAVLVMEAKLVAAPMVAVVLGWRGVMALSAWLPDSWRGKTGDPGPRPVSFAAAGLAAMLVVAVPYVRAWEIYGSPSWPVKLKLGSRTLTDGWMTMENVYQVKDDLGQVMRHLKFWTDLWTNPNMDVKNGLGPVFTLVLLPAALMMTFLALRRPGGGVLFLAVTFWVAVVIPGYQALRYSLHVMVAGSVAAGMLMSRLREREWQSAACAGVLALAIFGATGHVKSLVSDLRWRLNNGSDLHTGVRDRDVILKYVRVTPADPSYPTLKKLHSLMKPGETLATAVIGYHTLFYDDHYRYRVEHRPPKRWPPAFRAWTDPRFGLDEIPAWLQGLRHDGVAGVMVYAGTAEDRALSEPGSGYTLAHRQPDGEGEAVVVIYRRVE